MTIKQDFETVREALPFIDEPSGVEAEAHAALSRIENHLAWVERERDSLQHVIECADTPLMRDVMNELADLRTRLASVERELDEARENGRDMAKRLTRERDEAFERGYDQAFTDASTDAREDLRARLASVERERDEARLAHTYCKVDREMVERRLAELENELMYEDDAATWGGGPEPYEPNPYDGTYSEE